MAAPAVGAGQAEGQVGIVPVERGGIEQVEALAGRHAHPGALLQYVLWHLLQHLLHHLLHHHARPAAALPWGAQWRVAGRVASSMHSPWILVVSMVRFYTSVR